MFFCHCEILSRYARQVLLALFIVVVLQPANAISASCLWVSSYHQGYEWNDGIGRGIEKVLQGHCEIHKFFMDTKRNPDVEFGRQKAKQAFALVESLKPDLIIASDDNASRYFVKPYLEDGKIPVVFCGVNWTIDEYGYPYDNATGMVEFAPVMPIIDEIIHAVRNPSRGLYLSADVATEHTDYSWFKKFVAGEGITVDSYFVNKISAWEEGYLRGQQYDFIVVGNNAGINDWDSDRAKNFALQHAGTLTVTNYDWMMPFSMLAKTKIADEQGEWAGNVAVEVLQGMDITEIPIVPNRRWNLFANPTLLEKAGIQLRQDFLISAIKVSQ